MSDTHPFVGEKISYEKGLQFWDDFSEHYSNRQQGDIPRRIIDRLFETGILTEDCDVLEIGSGPGTYSLEMAPRVRSVRCLDSSPRMLRRLMSKASESGIGNIVPVEADWNSYEDDSEYGCCIATLCPGSGSRESVARMEKLSNGSCVLVSWTCNHGDDLNAQIWKALGKDYGYGFRGSTEVQDRLSSEGRDVKIELFQTDIEMDIPVEELVAKEVSSFKAYGNDVDVSDIVRSILEPDADDGIVHFKATNEMKLIYWAV